MTDEPGRIVWGGYPNTDRDYPRIVRCAPGADVRAVVISERAEVVAVHWLDGRTIPHLTPPSACAGCQAHTRWRLVSYLAAWVYGARSWSILEVPEEATREYLDTLEGRGGSIRGLKITLTRLRPYANARVRLMWSPASGPADSLPDPPNLREALAKVWSSNRGKGAGDATS